MIDNSEIRHCVFRNMLKNLNNKPACQAVCQTLAMTGETRFLQWWCLCSDGHAKQQVAEMVVAWGVWWDSPVHGICMCVCVCICMLNKKGKGFFFFFFFYWHPRSETRPAVTETDAWSIWDRIEVMESGKALRQEWAQLFLGRERSLRCLFFSLKMNDSVSVLNNWIFFIYRIIWGIFDIQFRYIHNRNMKLTPFITVIFMSFNNFF